MYLWGQPGRGAYAGVSQRIMNYICFQNSKYLFRFMREDQELYRISDRARVHINYHPEKPRSHGICHRAVLEWGGERHRRVALGRREEKL